MSVEKKEVRIAVTDGMLIPSGKDKSVVTAWSISLIFAISSIIYLCVTKPEPYLDILKFLPDGILVTFEVTVSAILLTIPIGLATGMGRLSENKIINLIASTYVEIIRGIPLLVQLFFIYYAIGEFVQLPDLAAAVIAMSVCYGAYMGEVFRAGIDAIDTGQTEAARSLGFGALEFPNAKYYWEYRFISTMFDNQFDQLTPEFNKKLDRNHVFGNSSTVLENYSSTCG